MNNIYFTLGPSQLYPTVTDHIQQSIEEEILSISHRGKKFVEIYEELSSNLRTLLNIPSTHHIFFTGNSIETMERIIANTVEEKSFHIMTGEFSQRFYQIALDLNKRPEFFEFEINKDLDFNQINVPQGTELICITENETGTGFQIPLDSFKQIKENNPGVLIAVDTVSSAPFTNVDLSFVDIAFFSVQKGFGLPAGLGVMIVSDAAIEKAYSLFKKGISIGSNEFSFITHVENEKNIHAPVPSGTPNVLDIYLLSKVSKDLNTVGIKNLRADAEKKAKLLYDFFDNEFPYKPLIKDQYRSLTTIVIEVNGKAGVIADSLAKDGFIVSKGYRHFGNDHLRIANFPAHSINDVMNLINRLKLFKEF